MIIRSVRDYGPIIAMMVIAIMAGGPTTRERRVVKRRTSFYSSGMLETGVFPAWERTCCNFNIAENFETFERLQISSSF